MVVAILSILMVNVALAQLSGGSQDKQCYANGQFYSLGKIINTGRSHMWCYGSYCGKGGVIKYWDDLNCPIPTTQNPSPNIPDWVKAEINEITGSLNQAATTEKPPVKSDPLQTLMFGSQPLFPPEQLAALAPPTPKVDTSQQGGGFFDSFGCWYEGRFYWPGSDIYNERRGFQCAGAYCDWQSNVQTWTDNCRATVRPPPRRPIDRT